MRTVQIGGLLLAIGLTAAGCSNPEPGMGRTANAKVCSPFAPQAAGVDPAIGSDAVALDDCMHRWGYRLAKSKDGADLVAQAVVAACSPVLERWNQSTLAQPQAGPDSAASLVTGKTNNTPAARFEGSQSKALFYVVQARAGNCAAP
jgi:hypothetical protein